MIYLEYTGVNAEAVSDFDVDNVFLDIVLHTVDFGRLDYKFSTENIFNRFRLGIVRGEISPDNVRFCFDHKTFPINKYGQCDIWPDGFIDLNIKMSEEILKTVLKNRKHE